MDPPSDRNASAHCDRDPTAEPDARADPGAHTHADGCSTHRYAGAAAASAYGRSNSG